MNAHQFVPITALLYVVGCATAPPRPLPSTAIAPAEPPSSEPNATFSELASVLNDPTAIPSRSLITSLSSINNDDRVALAQMLRSSARDQAFLADNSPERTLLLLKVANSVDEKLDLDEDEVGAIEAGAQRALDDNHALLAQDLALNAIAALDKKFASSGHVLALATIVVAAGSENSQDYGHVVTLLKQAGEKGEVGGPGFPDFTLGVALPEQPLPASCSCSETVARRLQLWDALLHLPGAPEQTRAGFDRVREQWARALTRARLEEAYAQATNKNTN